MRTLFAVMVIGVMLCAAKCDEEGGGCEDDTDTETETDSTPVESPSTWCYAGGVDGREECAEMDEPCRVGCIDAVNAATCKCLEGAGVDLSEVIFCN